MKERIIGFDLARVFAIFGMIVVNYNASLGDLHDQSTLGIILHEFSGNASATFVILAGLGLTLLAYKPYLPLHERKNIEKVVFKRSLFLFVLGLCLYPIWSADILHFYAEYMHVGLLLLYASNRKLLVWAVVIMLIFPVLCIFFDYNQGWTWATFTYQDFWTPAGFIRNIFFNGWNPVFPWAAFYVFGMYLGRLDWKDAQTKKRLWIAAITTFLLTEIITSLGMRYFPKDNSWYFLFDISMQIPPLPFYVLSSTSISLFIILIAVWIGERFSNSLIINALKEVGQMSLTHYLSHILVGIVVFMIVFHPDLLTQEDVFKKQPYSPLFILEYVCISFIIIILFSYWWKKKHQQGVLESLMRKMTG
jgi:uncharacterized protein